MVIFKNNKQGVELILKNKIKYINYIVLT